MAVWKDQKRRRGGALLLLPMNWEASCAGFCEGVQALRVLAHFLVLSLALVALGVAAGGSFTW